MRLSLLCIWISTIIFLISCQEKVSNEDNRHFRETMKDLVKPNSTTVAISNKYKISQDTVLYIVRTFARAHDKSYYLRLSIDSLSNAVLKNIISKTKVNDNDSRRWSDRMKSLDTIPESRVFTQNRLAIKYGKSVKEIQELVTDYRTSYEKEFPFSDE